jgi:hypothetical protein
MKLKNFGAASTLTAVLCLGSLGGASLASAASPDTSTPNSSALMADQAGTVTEEFRTADGEIYVASWDQSSGEIKIFNNSVEVGSTTMAEVQMVYLAELEAQFGDQVSPANCGAIMAGAGIANSALWGAAGLLALTGPAAGVAVGGGLVTGAITGVGGAFC